MKPFAILNKKLVILIFLSFIYLVFFTGLISTAFAQSWVDETFEDFIDGKFDASGNNIYVCREGEIRTIHRYDYNDDGYIDLLFCNTHDDYYTLPATLAEFLPNRNVKESELAVQGSLQVMSSDLNKDGYLDLVLGSFDSHDHVTSVIIYYGGPEGFTSENRMEIPCSGRSLSIQLADYNKNGWLDIAVCSFSESKVRIFYGSETGFDFNRRDEFDVPRAIDLKTADLNGDGWLDIIVCSYNDIANNNHFDMGTYIFWGDPKGFNHANSQWLPGFAGLGPVVADFDDDGYLDIFIPHYHAELVRDQFPSYLYWGSEDGFSFYNRTTIYTNGGAQGFAADFNKNGKLDLVVANHTFNRNHNTYSKVFYNDGNRFQNPEVKKLPTKGPHWSQNVDMGHIYNRSWTQTYESSVFHWNRNRDRDRGSLGYVANTPEGTKLNFKIRSAVNRKELYEKEWIKIENADQFQVSPKDRFMQYKAVFISDNGDRYPALDKVILNLNK